MIEFDRDESLKHFLKPKFHQQKIMVTVWWSAFGVVHYSFLKTCQSITHVVTEVNSKNTYPLNKNETRTDG